LEITSRFVMNLECYYFKGLWLPVLGKDNVSFVFLLGTHYALPSACV
jgi:hypothetical protein